MQGRHTLENTWRSPDNYGELIDVGPLCLHPDFHFISAVDLIIATCRSVWKLYIIGI